jgi:predicted transcriptional regulator
MPKIKDKVTCQMYGDLDFQNQIIEALKSSGVAIKVTNDKDYTTKKGDEGHYFSLNLTYEESDA